MMDEVWKPISNFDSYEVSNLGRVRSWRNTTCGPTMRKLDESVNGYRKVLFSIGGKRTHKYVHVLVLEAFVGPCPPGLEAAHRNGDRSDNRLENLRWVTHEENCADKIEHGTHQARANHNMARLTEEDVRTIRQSYQYEIKNRKVRRQLGLPTCDDLALRYPVSASQIAGIVSGRSWS